ncbi:hypothetical protein Dsin_023348 [Dipteronia sinensis]|uniref:Uncharacterized protein n=1 Tax=Dipteronia sinensis TaxID=43782 RepID=A0AAE0A337_9ROSI|nr:hypothetical protein Dsin_023348 [Dipteronia sinensis]
MNKTKDGVYQDPAIDGRIVSPTLMWVKALVSKSSLDFLKTVAYLVVDNNMVVCFGRMVVLQFYLVWIQRSHWFISLIVPFQKSNRRYGLDSSTTVQCREMEKAVGVGGA